MCRSAISRVNDAFKTRWFEFKICFFAALRACDWGVTHVDYALQTDITRVLLGALVLSVSWCALAFVSQFFAALRGRLEIRLYLPSVLSSLAIALAGMLISSRSVGAAAVPPTANDEMVAVNTGANRGSSGNNLGVALGGSVAANGVLLSYLVARRRQSLRATQFAPLMTPVSTSTNGISSQFSTSHDKGCSEEWAVLVRVLGAPHVESRDGRDVTFGKGKALELLMWMSEHRDSSTRSAARTALWDGEVQDATFSNVVSDLRRSLNSTVPSPIDEEWVPRTFTDRLVLHELVVTDAQLIAQRLQEFIKTPTDSARMNLRESLNYVRDLPFAGANYTWADAEGITTTHVITAVHAAVVLAEHAIEVGDTETLFATTEKGLRVLPGHEELVALRMKGHARVGNRAAIKLEWESYARAVERDAWAGGEPSSTLRILATTLAST